MKIEYVSKRFRAATMETIQRMEVLCVDYANRGFDLTLRQLYYQFVARSWLANTEQNYKNLGSTLNDARLAGLIDWNHISDRTRGIAGTYFPWTDWDGLIGSSVDAYSEDYWGPQPAYIEVWVEKEALANVAQVACADFKVAHFSCRGYASQTAVWNAANRLRRQTQNGKEVTVLYLGDHDPSGIDMTRDVEDRLRLFGASATIERIALNMNQVQQYNPPPNPAKQTDARFAVYQRQFGDDSWELDAMDPQVLVDLIQDEIRQRVDQALWDDAEAKEADEKESKRESLAAIVEHYDEVEDWLRNQGWVA